MLTELVPPPAAPIASSSGPGDSEQVAKRYSIRFPDDYRSLIRQYGSGYFCGTFICLLSPFSARYATRLESCLFRLSAATEFGIGYEVFPDVPGLYPWAHDENGGIVCWNVVGDTLDWNVVTVAAGPEYDVEEIDAGAEAFLVRAFSNADQFDIWREPFTPEELVFTPRPEPKVE